MSAQLDVALTYEQWQALRMFSNGRDTDFIAEASYIPITELEVLLDRLVGFDTARAKQLLAEHPCPERPGDYAPPAPQRIEAPPTPAASPKPEPAANPAPPTVAIEPRRRRAPLAVRPAPAVPAAPAPVEPPELVLTPTVIAVPPAAAVSVPPATASLLKRAEGSTDPRTQALAKAITELLASLEARLIEEERMRLEKAERERARAEAEADVDRLRRELEAAETRLAELTESDDVVHTGASVPAAAVRKWAKKIGLRCPATGPIPPDIVAAYRAVS